MDNETFNLIRLSRKQTKSVVAFITDLLEENIKKSNLRFDEEGEKDER